MTEKERIDEESGFTIEEKEKVDKLIDEEVNRMLKRAENEPLTPEQEKMLKELEDADDSNERLRISKKYGYGYLN